MKEKSHKRKQFIQSAASSGIGSSATFPVEVSGGGATIFITDVERFEKL
ncbi:MAG: cyclic-di-AMP receptor [Porcipelethomonas sp.]